MIAVGLGLLAAILIANVFLLVAAVFAWRRVNQAIRSSVGLARAFFDATGDKPSEFADVVDHVAAIFAGRAITTFNAALRGSAGGVAKAEQGQMFQGNPLAGLLKGKLGKSPLAVAALSMLGQQLVGSNGGNHSTASASRSDGMTIH